MHRFRWLAGLLSVICLNVAHGQPAGEPWQRHTIDAGSRGADGVRLADINGDGLLDITTGWEEGGEVRIYLNPGPQQTKQLWPQAVVGKARSVEDAVFVDLNNDGKLDVVACCEGQERSVWAFLARGDDPLQSTTWQAVAFPQVRNRQQWMFALPLQLDDRPGVQLILGSKGKDASISCLIAPPGGAATGSDEQSLSQWTLHRLTDAGWIMSLRQHDVDGDGDPDVVFSDRRGSQAGCWWLENPGRLPAAAQNLWPWNRHPIGGIGKEVMFLDLADVNGDGWEDVVAAVSGQDVVLVQRTGGAGRVQWQESTVAMPPGVGTGKAVAVADVDGDGAQDLIVTCENAHRVSGVFWLQLTAAGDWQTHDISGNEQGIKFDRIELLDLDHDGDLDVITCEERDNLGVIWYQNPSR